MRRKHRRKISYSVSDFDGIYWWVPRLRKWIAGTEEVWNEHTHYTDHAECNTVFRAIRVLEALHRAGGKDPIITQRIRHKGNIIAKHWRLRRFE